MTVSGLGSARTPLPPPPPATRAAVRKAPRNDFDHLTGADRELILAVTGQRIGPGFDPAREKVSGFAAALAAERGSGRLAPGQPVTAVFLKDLNRRYQRLGVANPVAPHLSKALDQLPDGGTRRFDVSA